MKQILTAFLLITVMACSAACSADRNIENSQPDTTSIESSNNASSESVEQTSLTIEGLFANL